MGRGRDRLRSGGWCQGCRCHGDGGERGDRVRSGQGRRGGTDSFEYEHCDEVGTPILEFDVRVDAAGVNMAVDAIGEMQVKVVIDVEGPTRGR